MPLGKLAEGTRAYPLLKAVLGKDPVTGDESPGDPQALIGGLMTLAGQEEVWGRVQSTGAIGRVIAWFNDAKKALVNFVKQVPALAMAAFKSLELMDIVMLTRGLAKVGAVFGNFVGSFTSWAIDAALKLAEIVFEVVSPGAWGTVQKTGSALKNIIKNPLPFVSNLGKAAKLGFQNFSGNFLTHLKNGLISWLTGSLSGVYIPTALSLPEIVKFAFSVLGLSWGNLRGKLVKAIGETAVVALEKGFSLVKTLVTKGPAAAWEQVRAELAALKDQVIEGIKGMIIEAVVTKAIPKLVAMFIPGAGFISAIVSIYDMVMVFVNKISEIAAVVSAFVDSISAIAGGAFVDSISAIAGGAIGAAAGKVESVLAGALSLAINFLTGFAGLGKIATKINGILQKIRAPIDKALDSMVAWIRKMAKKFLDALMGKDASPEEKQKRLDQASAAALSAVSKYSGKSVGAALLKPLLFVIKVRYRLTSLEPVQQGDTWAIRAEINPVKIVKTSVKAGKATAKMTITYEPHWPLDEFRSKAHAMKRAAEKQPVSKVRLLPMEEGSTTKRQSTDPLREGGQDRFRSEIKAFINTRVDEAVRDDAHRLMAKLQADHQQALQVSGDDSPANMAMVESRMNSQFGAMIKGQLLALTDPETVIDQVVVQTGAAKRGPHEASGKGRALLNLLLPFAKPDMTAKVQSWFKLK